MQLFFFIFLLLECNIHPSVCETDCPRNVIGRNNYFYLLSDNQTTADNARMVCSTAGGFLVESNVENMTSDLIEHSVSRYIPAGLILIEIYRNPSQSDPNNILYFKYRPIGDNISINDGENITHWLTPEPGKLRSIRLYESATGQFTKLVEFCFQADFDRLRRSGNDCPPRGQPNYEVYGGTSDTDNTITLYNYYKRNDYGGQASNLFFHYDVDLTVFREQSRTRLNFMVYIPDISVFTGARSDAGQSSWFWNNGTMITDPAYTTFDTSVCQQMTWPLTYDDGINLRPKSCSEEAYYICQVKFDINVTPVACNGSALEVIWNQTNFEMITQEMNSLFIELYINGNKWNPKLDITRVTQWTLAGLQQRTQYTIEATVTSDNCDGFNVSASATATTSYGKPDPVMNARILSDVSSDCVIEWDHNANDSNILRYTIYVNTGNQTFETNIISNTLMQNDTTIRTNVDLSPYPSNSMIQFQIRAFSCEEGSNISDVEGSCNGTEPPTVAPPTSEPQTAKSATAPPHATTDIVTIAVPIIAALIVVLLIVGTIHHKKRKSGKLEPSIELKTNELQSEEQPSRQSTIAEERTDPNIIPNISALVSEATDPGSSTAIYENLQLSTRKDATKLKEFYLSQCMNDFKNIKDEFKGIVADCKKNEPPHSASRLPQSTKKNRYKNIYPYDQARVLLTNNQYINAAYIDGYAVSKKYIASQGPKASTEDDFWEMIWLESTSIIVMLCKCVESGKTKCSRYWPDVGISKPSRNLEIRGKDEENVGGIMKRTFVIENVDSQEQRQIVHFHFISWPDHDIPLTTSGMGRLRKLVNQQHSMKQSNAPIVVHCSAGAGRTGTYIAIDNLIEEYNETREVDVVKAVMKMRKNRKDMVQNARQYLFIYKVLLESILLPETGVSAQMLLQVIESEDWNNYVKEEHDLLFCLSPYGPTDEENVYQNYTPKILSDDVNGVKIMKEDGSEVNMDAHFIENDRFPAWFVAASGPQKENEEEFLTMILQINTKFIVCLEPLEKDFLGSFDCSKDDIVDIGQHRIVINDIIDKRGYVIKSIVVSKQLEDMSSELKVVVLRSWSGMLEPPPLAYLAEVIGKAKLSMEDDKTSSVLIYCRDGCSRTGVFLAFANLLEELTCEQTVDVFRTVKDLSDMRQGMVDTLELYKLCYAIIAEHVSTNPP